MSSENEATRWQPGLRFDSDEAEFVRGFEAASVWTKLQQEPDVAMDFYMHGSNVEMAMRIAEALKREVKAKDLNANWLMVLFSASGKTLEETDPLAVRHY